MVNGHDIKSKGKKSPNLLLKSKILWFCKFRRLYWLSNFVSVTESSHGDFRTSKYIHLLGGLMFDVSIVRIIKNPFEKNN